MTNVFDLSSLTLFYVLHIYILFIFKSLPFVVYFLWYFVVLLEYASLFLVILLYFVFICLSLDKIYFIQKSIYKINL